MCVHIFVCVVPVMRTHGPLCIGQTPQLQGAAYTMSTSFGGAFFLFLVLFQLLFCRPLLAQLADTQCKACNVSACMDMLLDPLKTNWYAMFYYCSGENGELGGIADQHLLVDLNTSHVTCMNSMFAYSDIRVDLSKWDMRGVTNVAAMFYNADSMTFSLRGWDMSSCSGNCCQNFATASATLTGARVPCFPYCTYFNYATEACGPEEYVLTSDCSCATEPQCPADGYFPATDSKFVQSLECLSCADLNRDSYDGVQCGPCLANFFHSGDVPSKEQCMTCSSCGTGQEGDFDCYKVCPPLYYEVQCPDPRAVSELGRQDAAVCRVVFTTVLSELQGTAVSIRLTVNDTVQASLELDLDNDQQLAGTSQVTGQGALSAGLSVSLTLGPSVAVDFLVVGADDGDVDDGDQTVCISIEVLAPSRCVLGAGVLLWARTSFHCKPAST